MRDVAVVTGGAGGMGLATAERLGRDHLVVVADLGQERLDAAVAALADRDVKAESFACDVTDRRSVDVLVGRAQSVGRVTSVVHAAGISPQMGSPEKIVKINRQPRAEEDALRAGVLAQQELRGLVFTDPCSWPWDGPPS